MNGLRETLKAAVRGAAAVAVVPALCSFHVRARLFGPNPALMASTQAFGKIPGLLGQYLRRAFLQRVLAHCASTAAIEFGTSFSDVDTRIGEYAYIGPDCHIGFADIARDVLIAPCVHIPSGGQTHGSSDPQRRGRHGRRRRAVDRRRRRRRHPPAARTVRRRRRAGAGRPQPLTCASCSSRTACLMRPTVATASEPSTC
jgi:hypothetical protein